MNIRSSTPGTPGPTPLGRAGSRRAQLSKAKEIPPPSENSHELDEEQQEPLDYKHVEAQPRRKNKLWNRLQRRVKRNPKRYGAGAAVGVTGASLLGIRAYNQKISPPKKKKKDVNHDRVRNFITRARPAKTKKTAMPREA